MTCQVIEHHSFLWFFLLHMDYKRFQFGHDTLALFAMDDTMRVSVWACDSKGTSPPRHGWDNSSTTNHKLYPNHIQAYCIGSTGRHEYPDA